MTVGTLPEPLTPADCDLRDFPRMMIDIIRLRQSAFDAIIDDAAWRAGLNLWFSAWHSVPAGSLPDDDAGLAKAAGLGRDLRTWADIKEQALHGFKLCSDNRLYHETVCEFVLEAWIEKLLQRISSGAGNAKRWGGEFDPAPLDEAIRRTATLLGNLNPASKAIVKAMRKRSQSNPSGKPDQSEPHPTGSDEPSHRDNETVPVGSQETEKGQGYIIEEPIGSRQLSPDHVGDAFAAYDAMRREIIPNARSVQLTPSRRKKLADRLREIGGPPAWDGVIASIRGSPFLRGETSRNGTMVATIDWILEPRNLLKVMEGNFNDRTDGPRANGRAGPAGPIDALVAARHLLGSP